MYLLRNMQDKVHRKIHRLHFVKCLGFIKLVFRFCGKLAILCKEWEWGGVIFGSRFGGALPSEWYRNGIGMISVCFLR